MSLTPLTLTPKRAGEALGMGRRRVYALIKTGKLPHLKVGHRYYIPLFALKSFLTRALQVNLKEEK